MDEGSGRVGEVVVGVKKNPEVMEVGMCTILDRVIAEGIEPSHQLPKELAIAPASTTGIVLAGAVFAGQNLCFDLPS